jgi:hypothetical protein
MGDGSNIPAIATLLSLGVAYFGIHRADQRERDKQRRDDLRKIVVEFFALGASAEATLNDVIVAMAAGDESNTIEKKEVCIAAFDALSAGTDSLKLQLRLFGAECLQDGISGYASFASGQQYRLFKQTRIDPEFIMPSFEQFVEPLYIRREKISDEFALELKRLRTAGRLIPQMRAWGRRKISRLLEWWSQL